MRGHTAAWVQHRRVCGALFTYGDAGRNIVMGPGIFTTDMSLMRNVRLGGARAYGERSRRDGKPDSVRHHQHYENADARTAISTKFSF